MYVLICSANLSETFLILRRNERRMIINVHRTSCKVPIIRGTAAAQSLSCCATYRKVVGSIPAGVNEFFIDIILPIAPWAWGSTQPLTEMSTRSIPWGLTTYHHPVPLSRNLGTLTSWNPLGLSRPVMGLLLPIILVRL